MDLNRFADLVNHLQQASLQQCLPEWLAFLEFIYAYFRNRNIKPLVVEIGVYNNHQKAFYEQLLEAEHIGIDIKCQPNQRPPDILGDTRDIRTRDVLRERLSGRLIDLLFIDGDHSYDGVKSDYEIYGPLTKHIVALHDVLTTKLYPHDTIGVIDFWKELLKTDKQHTLLTIQRDNIINPGDFNPGRDMGIGFILKYGIT